MELCQRILDGKGMPAGWATNVAITIFTGIIMIMLIFKRYFSREHIALSSFKKRYGHRIRK